MILITGGAGYIGSHCYLDFKRAGYDCLIFDNLSEGHSEAVNKKDLYKGNLANLEDIRGVFEKYHVDAVIHFAASCYVGVSVKDPQSYYYNNVVNTLNLLQVMLEKNVKKIVFSSSCATYGNPQYTPLDEAHPQNPINPYGQTKLMIEKILQDYDNAYGLKHIALRYFNASGADNEADIGESHDPETHLIPLVLRAAAGKIDSIKIFGNDYETPDGTCIRDYIHVNDLAKAHRLGVEKLLSEGESNSFNLGIGRGYSVKDIIQVSENITGKTINKELAPRREGDPPILVASNTKAKTELGWNPDFTEISDIISTAWNWEQNRRY